ncbi:hypothetical protein CAEBREN_11172 [Caenorhabditis brenneri]|uniref:Uncharacterized protein n=1 Tax=Caenorhabditis brenneri TaxID=135651 RepID=G0P079_CAEBE|nr:hypothetical protein CAEBREN_11172 [Caenorhabditis brenneri]
MADLQVFDMNPPLNFPIPDKPIYQMNFNSTATHPSVANYVTETHPLTNHLQILDFLNPQNPSGSEDKKRQFFSNLLTPHYAKQAEIERKIDDLSDVVKQFIRDQQDVNKLLIERFLGQNVQSPITAETISENNRTEEQEAPSQIEEIEDKIEKNETIAIQQKINNPMPVYPVPLVHDASIHSPIRNRSISPEKMETDGGGMSVRDFLKNTMTVQKADEKILEEELERDRDEAAQAVRYNKFRVRNRPKKYKRSAVTFSSNLEAIAQTSLPERPTSSNLSTVGNPSEPAQLMEQIEQPQNNEVEENVFQPIVVPCVQRASELDLALMQPVFPTTSSYVLNSAALDPTSHATHISALTDPKFQPDPNNLWKAVDGVTQLLVDAPSLLDSDLRSFADHSHPSSFLPFVGNHEPLHRSAFVPAQYHKDRRIHQQMDPNITDTLRNL